MSPFRIADDAAHRKAIEAGFEPGSCAGAVVFALMIADPFVVEKRVLMERVAKRGFRYETAEKTLSRLSRPADRGGQGSRVVDSERIKQFGAVAMLNRRWAADHGLRLDYPETNNDGEGTLEEVFAGCRWVVAPAAVAARSQGSGASARKLHRAPGSVEQAFKDADARKALSDHRSEVEAGSIREGERMLLAYDSDKEHPPTPNDADYWEDRESPLNIAIIGEQVRRSGLAPGARPIGVNTTVGWNPQNEPEPPPGYCPVCRRCDDSRLDGIEYCLGCQNRSTLDVLVLDPGDPPPPDHGGWIAQPALTETNGRTMRQLADRLREISEALIRLSSVRRGLVSIDERSISDFIEEFTAGKRGQWVIPDACHIRCRRHMADLVPRLHDRIDERWHAFHFNRMAHRVGDRVMTPVGPLAAMLREKHALLGLLAMICPSPARLFPWNPGPWEHLPYVGVAGEPRASMAMEVVNA